MLKSSSVKKECLIFAILMSLVIAFGLRHKQILAAVQDGQVNMELWTYSVSDDENNKKIILVTNYSGSSSLKDIIVPNANDFLADSTFSVDAGNISGVSISKAAMQKAIANANQENGKFSISQTDGAALKTIAVGAKKLNDLFNTNTEEPDNNTANNIGSNITEIDLTGLDTTGATQMNRMFAGCGSLTSLTFGDNFDTSAVTDMSLMFCECSSLTDLTFGDNFDTSAVTDMSLMFSGCSSLTDLTFGDNFDTSAVTDMSGMFYGCSGLSRLTFGGDFDTNTGNNGQMLDLFKNGSEAYQMTFDADGDGNIEKIQIVKKDATAKLPEGLTKDGHTLDKWVDADGNEWDFDTEITENVGLKATWTAISGETEYTVTFDVDGGSAITSQTVISGNKITKPSNPTKDGYTFEGWYKEVELKDKFDFESETITEDTTLYAKWIAKNNTERFDTNDYSWNTSSDSSSSSSYSGTNSKNTQTSSLLPVLSQQIPAKLQTRAYLKGYGDETIKPDKRVTNAELATILTNLVEEDYEIIAQGSVWYEGSISYVLKKGIMKAEDCAKPNAFATVAQINSALDNVLRVCGVNPSLVNPLDASVIYGTANASLNSSENSQTVTRGQLANMIRNKFGRSKKQVNTKTFSDLSPSYLYYDAIINAVQ